MKIVADENIPMIEHYFGSEGELLLKPGRLISRDDLFDADILLVRSVTKVNELLLHDTPVKFVGSATAGIDHMDTAWLDQAGIKWSYAPGSNAIAVAEYVVCVIAALQKMGILTESSLRAAVIGVGRVGRLVVERLKTIGFEVLQCDPLRAARESDFIHTELNEIENVDLICLHLPLTRGGDFPTYHLIEKNFLQRQKKNAVLLNAGRGDTVAFSDLKQYANHLYWCFDVWENEPNIDLEIMQSAVIATPHIAGYSVESKLRGIQMIYEAAISHPLENISEKNKEVSWLAAPGWRDKALKIYDPRVTTETMKKSLTEKTMTFDQLRKFFPERHEFK